VFIRGEKGFVRFLVEGEPGGAGKIFILGVRSGGAEDPKGSSDCVLDLIVLGCVGHGFDSFGSYFHSLFYPNIFRIQGDILDFFLRLRMGQRVKSWPGQEVGGEKNFAWAKKKSTRGVTAKGRNDIAAEGGVDRREEERRWGSRTGATRGRARGQAKRASRAGDMRGGVAFGRRRREGKTSRSGEGLMKMPVGLGDVERGKN
jgi:hypothetical protein